MSKLTSLDVLLVLEIKDLYSAESQLVKALPKMAKAAADPALKEGFTNHLAQTKVHVTRLQEVAQLLGASPKGKVCKAMKGLLEEGAETIENEGDPVLKDLALITAAQKVEHYEISGYGSVKALANALGYKDVAALLKSTESEEGATDKNLTVIAGKLIKRAIAAGSGK
jgi:ferritin-like metal-binding protein YciE